MNQLSIPIDLITLIITFVIPTQLFAQTLQFPDSDPNRGLPERTGGAGGRVKPRLKFPSSPKHDNLRPRRRVGGGKRGYFSCVKLEHDKPSLKALIPSKTHIGKTIKNAPSVFVYVPKNTAKSGEFVLINSQDEPIYQQDLQLPTESGIIKIKVPESVKLELDKTYRWYFTIVCDLDDRSQDEYVNGAIKKIAPKSELSVELLQAQEKALEEAKIYAKNFIWYDTLEAIASVKKDYPLDWKSLLKSVGLEELSQEKILDCCAPEKDEQ